MPKHIHAKAPWDSSKTACRKKIEIGTWIKDSLDEITCPKCIEEMFDHLVGLADDELRVGINHIKAAVSLYDQLPEINMLRNNRALANLLNSVICYRRKK